MNKQPYDTVKEQNAQTITCGCRDKCSIKRSVLGAMCKLGSNVKIINSVLMDSVIVHDGCHLQNCIVCTGAQLQARAPGGSSYAYGASRV